MRREPAYLRDALRALEELQEFTIRTTQEQFLAGPLEQAYVFYRLVIFGEAMARLAPALQTHHPEIPWAPIISLRNRLVHAYFELDLPLVWQIATTQVEEIAQRLRKILETEFPGEAEGGEPSEAQES